MGAVATISSKGQVTVPVEVRRRLGVGAGDKVEFVVEEGRTVLRPVRAAGNPFAKWEGIGKGRFKNEEEMRAWEREMRGYDEWDEKDLQS